jgi:hypothetical protein
MLLLRHSECTLLKNPMAKQITPQDGLPTYTESALKQPPEHYLPHCSEHIEPSSQPWYSDHIVPWFTWTRVLRSLYFVQVTSYVAALVVLSLLAKGHIHIDVDEKHSLANALKAWIFVSPVAFIISLLYHAAEALPGQSHEELNMKITRRACMGQALLFSWGVFSVYLASIWKLIEEGEQSSDFR